VQAPREGYGGAVARGSITLGEFTDGRFRVVVWDDLRAEPIGSEDREAGRGGLSIPLPPYERHLAVTVEPLEASGAPASTGAAPR
jgi:hypothetical protein